jgi:hypothetical protein
MRGLIAGGLFKRAVVPSNELGHTVYKCTVTPKGEAEIKRITNALENAATSAAKPKAAKPKVNAHKVGVAAVKAAVTPKAEKPLSLAERASLVKQLDTGDAHA